MVKAGIIVFPGSNCDADVHHVMTHVFDMDVVFHWHEQPLSEHNYQLIVLPGGFSYGDYLRAGALAKVSPAMADLPDFVERGGLVLGICNGFQILTEAGLLPGTLMRNESASFQSEQVFLRVEHIDNPFFNQASVGCQLQMPIAHGEGRYWLEHDELLELETHHQIVLRYCDHQGRIDQATNVNGSVGNIAGLLNRQGNVLGMMPHPERCCERALGGDDGKIVFNSILNWLSRNKAP